MIEIWFKSTLCQQAERAREKRDAKLEKEAARTRAASLEAWRKHNRRHARVPGIRITERPPKKTRSSERQPLPPGYEASILAVIAQAAGPQPCHELAKLPGWRPTYKNYLTHLCNHGFLTRERRLPDTTHSGRAHLWHYTITQAGKAIL